MNLKNKLVISALSISLISTTYMRALTEKEFKALPESKKWEAYLSQVENNRDIKAHLLAKAHDDNKSQNRLAWGTAIGGFITGVVAMIIIAQFKGSGSNGSGPSFNDNGGTIYNNGGSTIHR